MERTGPMKKITTTRTAGVVAMTALPMGALAPCSGPGTVTVHGTEIPNSAAAGVFGPDMNSTSYAGRAAASPGLARGSL